MDDEQANQALQPAPAGGQEREIRNVGVLDLSGMESAEALEGVTGISNVGVILVPRHLMQKLSTIPMANVGSTIPVPDGARLRAFTGETVLSGDALANEDGGPDDVLVLTGELVLTSPVRKVGYGQLIATGEIIAPEGSETALGAGLTRMTGELMYYPYSEGSAVRIRSGYQQVSGEELANPAGQPTDILLVMGTLAVTSPIERLGYQHLVVTGTLVAPPGSEAALTGRVTALGGQVVYTTARPRELTGRHTLPRAFFEYLDEPVLLILTGRCTIEDDVPSDLFKQKVAGIIQTGRLTASREIAGLVQALAIQQTGRISISDGSDE
jgi:hypothetical protein